MKKEVKLKLAIILLIILLGINIYFTFKFYNKYKNLSWPCKAVSCSNKNISVTTLIEGNYYDYIIDAINNANSHIYVAMFQFKFYENNKVRNILEELIRAKQRGVDVKVLLDKSNWNKEIGEKNEKTLNYLKNFGIEAKFDIPDQTLHAKFFVIDNTVILGSTNLVYYAIYKNAETNIAIENENIAGEFINYFNFLWEKAS